MADANVVSFFEANAIGRLKLRDLTKLSDAVTAPITELQIDEDGAVKLKVADKLHAIDSLIKSIGGFAPEAASSDNKLTLEDLVMASMERGAGSKIAMEVVTGGPRAPNGPPQPQPGVRRVRL